MSNRVGSDNVRNVTRVSFDASTMDRLRAAAEEVAWLVGRGYPLTSVRPLVQTHHGLDELQLRAVERGMCADSQYRRHAARELDPEDIARRPLHVDGFNVLATLAVAQAGGLLVLAPDGTLRDLDWERGGRVDGDLDDQVLSQVSDAMKKLRPSKAIWYLDGRAPEIDEASKRLGVAGKKWRAEVRVVEDVEDELGKLAAVASGDSAVLDRCGTWFNLAAWVVAERSGVLRLQTS